MKQALAKWLHPVPGQPLNLGMGVSLGLHLLLATVLLCWPFALAGQPDKPEVVQTVKLVELPPPAPKPLPPPPPPPEVKQPVPPQPPKPQPRVAPRMQNRPPSTTRPSPTPSAAQENPVASSGPSVATTGEAIGSIGPVAAPAGGGKLPLGKEEVPEASVDLGLYHRAVWQRIEARKTYPLLARKRHWEGRVTVDFVIGPGGRLLESRIGASSGYDELDQAAIEAVRRAAPFPAPPAMPDDGRLKMEISVNFQLI
ncbi:MAG: TonB family protein [Desulfarculus sp.]|nr:TonB family protein [Desulfarculus sp.]